MSVQTIYLGRDNEFSLEITDSSTGDVVAFIDAGVTKMELNFGDFTASSDDGNIDFDNEGIVDITAGLLDGLTILPRTPAELVAYSATDTNGKVIIDKYSFYVRVI